MKILKLVVKGARGLGSRAFSFGAPRNGNAMDVVLVTGGPASGKTSLLRMIAAAKESVGRTGPPPAAAAVLEDDTVAGQLRAVWELSEEEQRPGDTGGAIVETTWNIGREATADVPAALRLLFMRRDSSVLRGTLEWMPAHRGIPADRAAPLPPACSDTTLSGKSSRDARDKYDSLLRALHDAAVAQGSTTMRVLEEKGVALRAQVPDALGTVRANVARMCPDLRLTAVEPRGDVRPWVWFQKRDGKKVELESLSHSEHQGFLIALVFGVLRHLGSVILVDTPELHIHPDDHARFFRALCDLGTGNQIIAATTSPTILRSVGPEQIIDLSKPEKAA